MSLKTWKEEFYPVKPNKKMSTVEAIEHSLRKWIGLRKVNLKKHGMVLMGLSIIEAGEFGNLKGLYIDSESCALCKKFYKSAWDEDSEEVVQSKGCPTCPLKLVLGKVCDFTHESVYGQWISHGNPEPMIRALKRALKAEMKNVSKD